MDQPGPAVWTGQKCQDPVQTCLPPMPLFFPPHQANPVTADTAERKVTARWQDSGICSSCTTGKSSVMTQSSLPDLHAESCPLPTRVFPATCGACTGRQSRGLSSSVGVGSKQREGTGGHPCLEKLLAQSGPQHPPLQTGVVQLACLTTGVLVVVSGTGWRGFAGWMLCHGSHLCIPVLCSLECSV